MSEIHSNLYLKHPDMHIHSMYKELLTISDLNSTQRIVDVNERKKKFIEISVSINPEKGETLALVLLKVFEEDNWSDFGSENISDNSGYIVSHWVHGSAGFDIQVGLMYFFFGLNPRTLIQSWSCGDDDSFESWLKIENGLVRQTSDEPYSERDEYIFGTAYHWWHSDMPSSIKEGFLNDKSYQEVCERNFSKVFLSKSSPTKVSDVQYEKWRQEAVYDQPKRGTSDNQSISSAPSPESDGSTEELLSRLDDAQKIMRFPLLRYWYRLKYALMGK